MRKFDLNSLKETPVDAFTRPCACGSCEDAFNVALTEFSKLVASDHCPAWTIRVSCTMAALASMHTDEMLVTVDEKGEEIPVDKMGLEDMILFMADKQALLQGYVEVMFKMHSDKIDSMRAAAKGTFTCAEVTKTH